MACRWLVAMLFLSCGGKFLARPDDFPGWLGEKSSELVQKSQISVSKVDPTKATPVSWKPRTFLYKGFLSDEECDHLIALAKEGPQKTAALDQGSQKPIISNVETNFGMLLEKDQDGIVSRIEDKIAVWTFLGKENGEQIQVLKYEKGEKYETHNEFFGNKVDQGPGDRCVATVLMYLSDVAKGGETVFPEAKRGRHFAMDVTLSNCAKKGIAVKPKKGDALLLFSLSTDATPDASSLHGDCPVIEGEKWVATKRIHVQSFSPRKVDLGGCKDENEKCGEWAAYGECQKNPTYMIGTSDQPGYCRRSCRVC